MNCTGIARFCDGSQPRPHRLTGITPDKPIRNLCAACLEAAKNLGYQPEPVPTWIARGVGKDLTGALVA